MIIIADEATQHYVCTLPRVHHTYYSFVFILNVGVNLFCLILCLFAETITHIMLYAVACRPIYIVRSIVISGDHSPVMHTCKHSQVVYEWVRVYSLHKGGATNLKVGDRISASEASTQFFG